MARDSLYSCFIIEADQAPAPEYRPFTYSRSMPITGGVKPAGEAHTNVPRSGDTGLPMGWEARISHWRATINLLLNEPIMDWAAETKVSLHYNDKIEQRNSLLELLMAPQPLGEWYAPMRTVNNTQADRGYYLWLRENIGYEARVITERPGLVEDLQKYLITHTQHARLICWIRLDGEVERHVY